MELGVCYYPEHWPSEQWPVDAQRMREMNIRWVRIAEFAWSRIEPSPGEFDWEWLDRAIDTLHAQGLKVVMCTPTATPPKWLVDQMPDMLAVDAQGHQRRFGSRRHYCFSHAGYLEHSRRITRAMAERYGNHTAVAAWQTDNEFGCHNTAISYSDAAATGFRDWLAERYGDVAALNRAWGTVFWSQEYRTFDEVDLPHLTVTEANPSHRLDFQRYSSWAVARFQEVQYQLLKALSPGRPVSHNFMGFYTEFNHHEVAANLDIATWDSYPLGFTQDFFLSAEEKVRYARTGHPDVPAFHHDLYRGMCASVRADAPAHGRWWVMEQQPGPVNWAQWNLAPHDGMVRLWTWQAFAHGAEVVSYFRWRQAPFAQEQMHTGLNRPDFSLDQGGLEALQVGQDLTALSETMPPNELTVRNRVALVFDYDGLWMGQIQPQGKDHNGLALAFRLYSALRQLGLDVDIVSPAAPLAAYELIVLPVSTHISADLLEQLQSSTAQLVFAPRAGSKTLDLHVPLQLAPGPLQDLLGLRVNRVASLPPGFEESGSLLNKACTVTGWFEDLALNGAQTLALLADGRPLVAQNGRACYVAGGLDGASWISLLENRARAAGLTPQRLPADLRVSRIGHHCVALNFSAQAIAWSPTANASVPVLGEASVAARDLSIWRLE
ncbi:beta-galactosidase [Hydrogenophaga crassostreae]|uniref:Beta-galactosidase n=1 Tax=Hydrogenophaga crassostreae TaxID=1763535 RepID=A0A167GTF8_9BURK|nr:beta-galactosidase [Hydrogenophaga crassostreae]AOW11763.1 beta-galactosidase [Hydrogenophaga crassostreae]OAD39855.1 beta-galactosidase [Hydrogenophaga crassostreae]